MQFDGIYVSQPPASQTLAARTDGWETNTRNLVAFVTKNDRLATMASHVY